MADLTEFERDSLAERGRILTGTYRHYCDDWDGLTIDETCQEWPCIHADAMQARERST